MNSKKIFLVAATILLMVTSSGMAGATLSVKKLTLLTTDNPSFDTEPDWGPADSKIIYMRYYDDWWTNSAIYDMNVDGTGKRELIPVISWHAKYSPDGTKIAYEAYKGTLV